MAIDDVVNLRPNFSLWLRAPFFQGLQPRVELSAYAEDFDVRIADEGSDYMSFKVSTDSKPINILVDWFETLIGGEIRLETDTRDVVWRGFLNVMIFSGGGDSEIRDMSLMANQAIVDYSGGTSGVITDPNSSQDSIDYFGAKLIHISDTSDLSLADATRQAQNYLRLNSQPRARPYSGDNRDTLEFQFMGYLNVLDWQEDSIASGITVKAAIEQVITNTGQGIITFQPDSIQDNGQTWTSNISGTGLELIRKLTNMLDSSGNVWRFWLDNDNVAHFEPVEFLPYYYRRVGNTPASSGVFIAGAKAPTWAGKAGVILRNMAYPITTPEVGSPFLSRQDRYVESIRFNKNGDLIIESLSKYDEVWAQAEEYDFNQDEGLY